MNLHNVSIAFDMCGCPNRCRHCYLGVYSGGSISENEVRELTGRFRDYRRGGEPFFKELNVSTSFREPDFSEDYRHLYDLENELSDGRPARHELLSIWRLARDETYAQWAKEVGPTKCQITLFGVEETNDWFYRRKGAFKDCLIAMDRLLAVGIAPRLQTFMMRKCLSELSDLMRLVDKMHLRERVQALGHEFEMFIHTPGPDGEGRKVEDLRPTIDEIDGVIPESLLVASKKHFGCEQLWKTEGELVSKMLDQDDRFPIDDVELSAGLWLLVDTNLDVFSNLATLEPWWKLGNLHTDQVDDIVKAFEESTPLGMRAIRELSYAELARRFGDPSSREVYDADGEDLRSLWIEQWCEQQRRNRCSKSTKNW